MCVSFYTVCYTIIHAYLRILLIILFNCFQVSARPRKVLFLFSYSFFYIIEYAIVFRLMFREEVTVMDAIVVVTLMESSMQSAALISADNCLHSSFPCDAMLEYQRQSKQRCTKF